MKSQFATSKENGVVKMNEKEKTEVAVIEKEQLNNAEINENTIKNLIYVVRGKQVMVDSDLAMLYQVETKNLNKAMKKMKIDFRMIFVFNYLKQNTKL